jgi:hypothetical protein
MACLPFTAKGPRSLVGKVPFDKEKGRNEVLELECWTQQSSACAGKGVVFSYFPRG